MVGVEVYKGIEEEEQKREVKLRDLGAVQHRDRTC